MGLSSSRNIQVVRAARGIERIEIYYVTTRMSEGLTAGAITSDGRAWYREKFHAPTEAYPYAWRYSKTYFSDGTTQNSPCELIGAYQSGVNRNLLDDTDFLSDSQMGAWSVQSVYAIKEENPTSTDKPNENPTSTDKPNEKPGTTDKPNEKPILTDKPKLIGVQGAFNGRKQFKGQNYYSSMIAEPSSRVYYREILQQELFSSNGLFSRIEKNSWYTLSFWAKGTGYNYSEMHLTTYLYPNLINPSEKAIVNGNFVKLPGDGYVDWQLTRDWQFFTLTFKTGSLAGNDIRNLLFRVFPLEYRREREVHICMPKLEVGIVATPYVASSRSYGVTARYGDWRVLSNYMAGRAGDLYHDIVSYKGKYYECLVSHTSDANNSPDKAPRIWREGEQREFTATNLFFAKKTFIENAVVRHLATDVVGGERIEASGSNFSIFGKGMKHPSIVIGYEKDERETGELDEKGQKKKVVVSSVPVLRFQDGNTGEPLYDLGPNGMLFNNSKSVPHSWQSLSLIRLTEKTTVQSLVRWVVGEINKDLNSRVYVDNHATDFPSRDFDYGKYDGDGNLLTSDTMYERFANSHSIKLGYGAIFHEGYSVLSNGSGRSEKKYKLSNNSLPDDVYDGRAFEFDPNTVQEPEEENGWKMLSPEKLYETVGLPVIDDNGHRAVVLHGWYCSRRQIPRREEYCTYPTTLREEPVYGIEIVRYDEGYIVERKNIYYSDSAQDKGLYTGVPRAAVLLDWMEHADVPLWEADTISLRNEEWRRRWGLGY